VEVHTERAENKEVDLEQQKAGATALTSPQYTQEYVEVETDRKTQFEKTARNILATNTEDQDRDPRQVQGASLRPLM
jgi:hypothetical protein